MLNSMVQVMRLLSGRGVDWLRQHVMDLPDPLPKDHPDLPAVAYAAAHAPALTGLMGRPAPVEVLARRRLTARHVHDAAMRHLGGTAEPHDAALIRVGQFLSPEDAAWRLACEQIAVDPDQPMALRLALCPAHDRNLTLEAETLILAPLPRTITAEALSDRAETVIALWGHGAHRPALSHPSRVGQIMAQVNTWAALAPDLDDTALVARIVTCLLLIDPGHDVSLLMSRLMPLQRPDGAFPARLKTGDAAIALSSGVTAVMPVLMALHLSVMGRWRGPRPETQAPRPLHGAMLQAGQALALRLRQHPPSEGWLRLLAATALTRALSQDWFARLEAPGSVDDGDRLSRLAAIAFRDVHTARRLRAHLGPARLTACGVLVPQHMAWLTGACVSLSQPLPPRLARDLDRAASGRDIASFVALSHQASLYPTEPGSPARRAMARHVAAQALARCEDPHSPLPEALDALATLALLALTGEDDLPMAMVA